MPYKPLFAAVPLLLCVLFDPCLCSAEKIILVDGQAIDAKILYRKRDVIWYKTPLGSMGLKLKDIQEIRDDSGSLSKYDYRSLYKRALSSLQSGQLKGALYDYNLLVESFPGDINVRMMRAKLNHKLRHFQDALDDYVSLMPYYKTDSDLMNNLGAVYLEMGNVKSAQEWLEKSLAVNPGNLSARRNLALLYLQKKDFKKAIPELSKILSIDNKDADCLYNLGMAYISQEDWGKAQMQVRKLLQVSPGYANAQEMLAYINSKTIKK